LACFVALTVSFIVDEASSVNTLHPPNKSKLIYIALFTAVIIVGVAMIFTNSKTFYNVRS
jgi:hypothetical protein